MQTAECVRPIRTPHYENDGWCVVLRDIGGLIVGGGRRHRGGIGTRAAETITGRIWTAVVPAEEAIK